MLIAAETEIARFVDVIFRYAREGTYVSLRAFDQHDRGRGPVLIEGVELRDDRANVIAAAVRAAQRAGNADSPAVFAPPVATFAGPHTARSADVACGVALTVEMDQGDPAVARAKLERLLGPVTVAVASGGEWVDADGVVHARTHLHWRLSEPTLTPEEHGTLQDARRLAALYVGGDPTAAPPAHPLRWPGSWNRKGSTPRMAMIVGGDPRAEIHLADAMEQLAMAVEGAGLGYAPSEARVAGPAQAPVGVVASALAALPNEGLHWDQWVRVGMATYAATGGARAGLDAWEEWSAKSAKHVSGSCQERWQHFASSPPGRIGAGTIFFMAKAQGWHRPRPQLVTDMSSTTPNRLGSSAWQGEFTRGERGPYATVSNALLVLARDGEVAGLAAYDEFSHRIVVTRPPPRRSGDDHAPGPYPRAITDTDVTAVQCYMERTHGMRISQPVAQQAVVAAAEMHRVHPVREWLDGLEWDGTPRVSSWLGQAFGCPLDNYHRAVGRKFLCAAVRRVRQPGCKFDHVLVLEGRQGRGKSRACEALFGSRWFTDNLSHDLASKDAQQGMSGRWGLELAELAALVRSGGSQASKAFFSRRVDYFRPPYGKAFVERPRQCVFVGTTNNDDYLSDDTGNRRYWPVHCQVARVEWIEANREQLWAEACVLEAAGEALWLEQEEVAALAAEQQDARMAQDVWTTTIRAWIRREGRTRVNVNDALEMALSIPSAQRGRAAEMRVSAILKGDGWTCAKARDESGRSVRMWRHPSDGAPDGAS